MSTPTPHSRQHRNATRSSPILDHSSVGVHEEPLFHLRADINVKDTVCGRDSNGKRLAQQVFEGSSWAALKELIFQHCLPHIQFKATYEGEPRVWTVDSEKPTMHEFDSFISIKMGRYFFKPGSHVQANRYISDHRNDTFTISVLKWGNLVNTATDFQMFQEQCIQPQVQDRAGAAAESAHAQMVSQLKEKWGHIYTTYEANWRMWAAHILKTPTYQHAVHISNPPPAIMLHLFDAVPNGAQERNQNLQRSLTAALDVVESCLEDLGFLKRLVTDVVSRIETSEVSLCAKRRIIEGFQQELTPVAVRADLVTMIHNIPNLDDEAQRF
ncbi:hypothetical protein Ae201684P_003709 [Aphanomyces euteiches]|nr:hypothetical protein Ae201684P_003709 [Aphanomyces euteiches]